MTGPNEPPFPHSGNDSGQAAAVAARIGPEQKAFEGQTAEAGEWPDSDNPVQNDPLMATGLRGG